MAFRSLHFASLGNLTPAVLPVLQVLPVLGASERIAEIGLSVSDVARTLQANVGGVEASRRVRRWT